MSDDPAQSPAQGPAGGPRLDARQSQAIFGGTRLLKTHGNTTAAELAVARLRSTGRRPTVVVVGEVKRGKSSLVNALLGAPGLSPVGVDVTTAAFIRFVPPSAKRPAGTAAVYSPDGTRTPIDAADLPDWVGVDGRHRADSDAPLALGAELAVAGPHLPQLSLVDTPGVGGLVGSHGRLAASVAAQATILLFVCDAGQRLTAPELEFLTGAAANTETVVLAMTKVDKFPQGWAEVLAENRALLAEHAPRFAHADIVPVSSQDAIDALALPDGPARRAMTDAAGIERLAAVLRARAADVDGLAVANAARIVRSGLDQVTAALTLRRAAVTGGAAERAGLEAERARLGELRALQQRWTLDLEARLGRLRQAVHEDIRARVTEVRDRWYAQADKVRQGLVPKVAREFMAQVCSDLQAVVDEVTVEFDRRLTDLVAETYALAGRPGTTPAGLLDGVAGPVGQVRVRERELIKQTGALLDPGLAATAFLGAGMAAKLPFAISFGFWNPVAIAVGGGWLAVNVAFKAIRAGRVRLRTWVGEVTAAMQADLGGAVDGGLRDVKPEVVVGFRQYLTDAVAELDGAIRESDRAAAASGAERRQRAEALDRHLAAVAAQQDLLDALLRDPGTSAPAGRIQPATPIGDGTEETS